MSKIHTDDNHPSMRDRLGKPDQGECKEWPVTEGEPYSKGAPSTVKVPTMFQNSRNSAVAGVEMRGRNGQEISHIEHEEEAAAVLSSRDASISTRVKA